MIFAGIDARGYDFFLERVGTGEFLEGFERAVTLKERGWDVEALESPDGSEYVFLGVLYKVPSAPRRVAG